MSSKKSEKPAVMTYADHELIMPVNKLRHAAVPAGPNDEDPIARAEKALADLSSEFSVWMHSECERLDTARQELHTLGFTKKTHDSLFHAAHDIRGQAATFGFPLIAAVADSLCRLIEHTPEMTRIPLTLVDQHVDAVRAIIREYARPAIEVIASALTGRLRDVTDDFLRIENKDRLEEMADILGPPLVPDQPPN
jgi:HPt (histidine-containing phosphotransfer) domain-containing protein